MRSQNVGWGDLRLDDMAYIDDATHLSFPATEVRTGDVLLNITGASIGRSAVATPALDGGNVNQHVCEIRLKSDRMDPRFVNAFLLSRSGQSQIDMFQAGGNRQGLNFQQVGSIQVPDLPIEQQRAIGAASQNADDLIATLERLIAKKQAIKQGMMQQLLTGRTRLPGFAGEWSELTLGDVAQFSKGMGLPKSAIVPGGHLPCVHYGELFTHYGSEIGSVTSRTNDLSLRVRSVGNDVLMPTSDVTPRGLAKASAIGLDGVVLGGDILVIRPNRQQVFGPFLAHAIRHDANQVLQLVRGSTVYHLYASDMKTFRLALPNVDEQRQISEVLRDAEHEIEGLRNRLMKANAVKSGMMQQLLTGRTRLPSEVRS